METMSLPTPLARGFMRLMPASVLAQLVAVLMRKMEHRHPRLFRNLARLDRAVVFIEPSDIPHRFALRIGVPAPSVEVLGDTAETPDACIKGNLDALLNLLEGRIDGDMMFFARDILISGDISVIVALRNTLDREEINLLDDIASLGGPFARPVKNVAHVLGRIGARVRGRIQELGRDEGESRLAAECESLRGELEALKVRVERMAQR